MRPTRPPTPEEPSAGDEDHTEEWEDEDNPDPYAIVEDDEDLGDDDDTDFVEEPEDEKNEEDGARDDDESGIVVGENYPPLTPWAQPPLSGEIGRGSIVLDLAEAAARIDAAHIEFQYDVDAAVGAAYLLAKTLEGTMGPRLVGSVEAILGQAGVLVLRRGIRPGVGADGREYQHFFRVENRDGSLPSKLALRAALRHRAISVDAGASETPANAFAGSLDVELLPVLERAIAEAADARRLALGALHIHDRRLVGYRRRIEDTRSLAQEVFRAIRQKVAASSVAAALAAQLKMQSEQISRQAEEIDEALSIAADREFQAANMAATLRWYQDQHEETRSVRLETTGIQEKSISDISKIERDDFVHRLLPEVHFLGDSIPVLWNETDRAAWLRTLTLLALNYGYFLEHMNARGYLKKLGGQPDWMEVRQTKGSKDMARLYFTDKRKQLCAGRERWVVRLHMKQDAKQQSRIIASLP